MKIDFNRQINRKHTDCAKWDGQGGDYIPLWIVDMDLPVAEPVLGIEKPPGASIFWLYISGRKCVSGSYFLLQDRYALM